MKKNKKAQSGTMIAISVFVIIAIIAVSIVWQLTQDKTQTATIANDLFVASNNTCVRVTDNCIESTTSLYAGALQSDSNFTICGGASGYYGYSLDETGALASLDGANINASYVGADCARLTGTTSTIVNYIPLLLAVALLAGVAIAGGLTKT